MKQKILDALHRMGFITQEMGGVPYYEFMYEGQRYLWMPDGDDDFLHIAIPGVLRAGEDDQFVLFTLMDRFNCNERYVKACMYGSAVWLAYERELIGDEDLEQVIAHMVNGLHHSIDSFVQLIKNVHKDVCESSDLEMDIDEDSYEEVNEEATEE